MIRNAFLAVACLAAASAQAQVYKCVDPSGKVFYSQNPCPATMKRESMSRGDIQPAPAAAPQEGAPDKAAKGDAKGGPKTPAEQEQAFRKRQLDQAKAAKQADQSAAAAQAKEANCRNARQRLAQFEMGRVAKIDDKGERYYMDDAQIETEKARARADISQMCN